jgi:hypothetical protein
MIYSIKKYQYYLSIVVSLLSIFHFYRLDFSCIIYFLPISLIIFSLPFLWGNIIYNGLIEGIENPISYKIFQYILTIILLLLLIFFILIIFFEYIPKNYIQGVC